MVVYTIIFVIMNTQVREDCWRFILNKIKSRTNRGKTVFYELDIGLNVIIINYFEMQGKGKLKTTFSM